MKLRTGRMMFLAAFVMLLSVSVHAQTVSPKALWCAGNTTFYLTYDSKTYNAGGSYDGQKITNVFDVRSMASNVDATEVTVPWTSIATSVTRVVINPNFSNYKPQRLECFFKNFSNATFTGLNYINTSQVYTLKETFRSCKALTSLEELRNWDTRKVTAMNSAFTGCSGLTSLEPIKDWNTSNVTNMSSTFSSCTKLTSLEGIKNWDTHNVTTMNGTFNGCTSLTSLESLREWNTSNVTSMSGIFSTCYKVTSLEGINNWDTSKVTTLNNAFATCLGITSLEPIKDWNTSKVTNMEGTFNNCSGLTSLEGIKDWNTSNVTNMNSTFLSCSKLTSLEPIKNWNTSKVTSMGSTFSNCAKLTSLEPIKDWNTSNVTNMGSTFESCSSITSLEPIKDWNTSKVTRMDFTFRNCSSLTLVNLSGWDAGNVTDMTELFMDCKALRGITFGENFKMNKVSKVSYEYNEGMFSGCNKLRYIDFYKSNYATSGSGLQFPLNTADRTAGVFNGVPETTVIFLPKKNRLVTNVTNVVYSYNGDASDLRCPKYYSIDKVDIEFPHSFKTNEAVYLRDMTGKQYGSVTLPYEFTTNSDIQAYSLSKQEMKNGSVNRLTFTDVASVPAHTPFAFKRLNSNPQSTEFLMKDNSGNFGIIVNATRSTNAAEKTWTSAGPDATIGSPYIGSTGLSNWKTKGYYVKETVTDYDGMYFIQDNEFKRAVGNLNLVDHRVLFYPTDNTTAKFFSLSFSDDEVITAIEAAETEKTLREATDIYDATGRRQVAIKKGLNIVRMSDGTVRKVIVK